jgi:geranylgeranyl pyrophosphate synthase
MPSEEQYFDMVINKTSVLPRMSSRMIGAIVEHKYKAHFDGVLTANMVEFIEKLGAAF